MRKPLKPAEQPLGIEHFVDFIYGGQPEWSLFVVRAPIARVTKALAGFRKVKTPAISVPVKSPRGKRKPIAPLAAIVQVRDNPWTVVFRSLLTVDSNLMEAVSKEARELSARLRTRAIAFVSEDTSGSRNYEIFVGGKAVESAEWEHCGDFWNFKSTLRQQPAIFEIGDEFPEERFCNEGIYLPACYPVREGDDCWLVAGKRAAKSIERAELLDIPPSARPTAVQKALKRLGVFGGDSTWQSTRDWPNHSTPPG